MRARNARIRFQASASGRRSANPGGSRTPDPGEAPSIALSQVRAALERRSQRRREAVGELRAALGSLAEAVERHTAKVGDVRRAVEAQGGDLEPLRFYDTVMARFRLELRAAERTLADVFRVAAEGSAAQS